MLVFLNPDPDSESGSTDPIEFMHCLIFIDTQYRYLRSTVIGQDNKKTAGGVLEKLWAAKLMLDTRKTALKVVFAHN
jgi:hypothetical protein